MANEDWMGAFNDDKPMNRIIIPASHDSGMARKSTTVKTLAATSKDNACTQALTIGEQMVAGIRWFDVRLKRKDNKDRCFHGAAFGEDSVDIAKDTIKFLNAHRGEVIIILLTKSGDGTYERFLDNLVAADGKYHKTGDPVYDRVVRDYHRQIATLTLGQLRGRVIVAMDQPPPTQHKHTARRIVRAKLKKSGAEEANTPVTKDDVEHWHKDPASKKYSYILNSAGSYSNINDSKKIRTKQLIRFQNLRRRVDAMMPVYYTTNTSPIGLRGPGSSIKKQDKEMWKDTTRPKWAVRAFATMSSGVPIYNAVMMDFASEERCSYVRQKAAEINA